MFVAEIEKAWLVGQHATPVTAYGMVLMTSFRDQPKMMVLEKQDDLNTWITNRRWEQKPDIGKQECMVSFVNRLDPNYFHWIVEWCGQVEGLFHYQEVTGVMPKVLVRAGGPRFIRESLELLGIGSDRHCEWKLGDEELYVDKLIVTSLPGNRVACSPNSLAWLRDRFLAGARAGKARDDATRRIYIARNKGGWRSILNEDEVIECLLGRGFEVMRPEGHSLVAQIRRFSEAEMIVGLHGAGLVNILFAPHASLLELAGSYGGGEYYSMATCLGQRYYSLAGASNGDDVSIDCAKLSQAVDLLAQGWGTR